MAEHKTTEVRVGKLLYWFGLIVFGGMYLTAIIDGHHYAEKGYLMSYLFFITGCAIIYYAIVFLFDQKKLKKE
ncbi:hypothetical protein [Bacillus suaedae]|uniref:Uncharacterized protein n=1 Tax=Halalkalibacter suaedae TaxID=2822140 RepID=A0A940WWM0_9BACI|nr:hypothetical protein [Bacillus suaedae]MBP3949545.1 hypothetical protein [Bacillus suaedae]